MIPSKDYYNEVAAAYHQLLHSRLEYLLGIESKIAEITGEAKIDRYLDIGCGDGTRSMRLIDSLKPRTSVLLDESKEMVDLAKQHKRSDIRVVEANFLDHKFSDTYSLVTSLWNVFGHLETRETRFSFLKKIHSLLDENGAFFFDINNRYNIHHYGLKNVISNFLKDLFTKEGSGNFYLNSKSSESKVYIHHFFELDELIQQAGFSRCEKYYISYDDGKTTGSFFSGQVLYHLKK